MIIFLSIIYGLVTLVLYLILYLSCKQLEIKLNYKLMFYAVFGIFLILVALKMLIFNILYFFIYALIISCLSWYVAGLAGKKLGPISIFLIGFFWAHMLCFILFSLEYEDQIMQ